MVGCFEELFHIITYDNLGLGNFTADIILEGILGNLYTELHIKFSFWVVLHTIMRIFL